MVFLQGNAKDPFNAKALNMFDILESELPTVFGMKMGALDNLEKHRFPRNTLLSAINLEKFVVDFYESN
jgi:hypothetical protein